MDEVTGVWPVDVRMSGYVCHGATFYHGITIELLLTSMWSLVVISVRRKYIIPRFCELS